MGLDLRGPQVTVRLVVPTLGSLSRQLCRALGPQRAPPTVTPRCSGEVTRGHPPGRVIGGGCVRGKVPFKAETAVLKGWGIWARFQQLYANYMQMRLCLQGREMVL